MPYILSHVKTAKNNTLVLQKNSNPGSEVTKVTTTRTTNDVELPNISMVLVNTLNLAPMAI